MQPITVVNPLPRLPILNIGEEIIKQLGVLKFRDYEFHNPNLNLNIFLERFDSLNENYTTVGVDDSFESRRGSHKTLVDIYRLAKNYLPSITFTDLLKQVETMFNNDKGSAYFSPESQRITFKINSPSYYSTNARQSLNEFGYEGLLEMFKYISR